MSSFVLYWWFVNMVYSFTPEENRFKENPMIQPSSFIIDLQNTTQEHTHSHYVHEVNNCVRKWRLFSIPMKSFSVLKIFFVKTCEYLGFSRLDSLNFLHWSKWSVSKFRTVKPSLCAALESEPLQIFTSFDIHFRV